MKARREYSAAIGDERGRLVRRGRTGARNPSRDAHAVAVFDGSAGGVFRVMREAERAVEVADAVMAVGALEFEEKAVGVRNGFGMKAQLAIRVGADANTLVHQHFRMPLCAKLYMNNQTTCHIAETRCNPAVALN